MGHRRALDCQKTDYDIHVHQPWAKCGLFAAAALRPIFCGLIAAFCLKTFSSYGLQYPPHFPESPSSRHVRLRCEITWNQWQTFSLQIPWLFSMINKSPILIYGLIAKFLEGRSFQSLNQLILLPKHLNLPFLADNNNIGEKVPCSILANLIA